MSFIDFISKDSVSTISIKPGGYIDMPEEVESSVFFESGLWKVRADYSRMIDLTLTPFYEQKTRLSLGLLSTEGVCCFGKWNGIIRFDGKEVKIRGLIGWAEEFSHRW